MSSQSRVFLGSFAVSGAVVFALAQWRHPGWAVGGGVVGLLVHWRLSTGADDDAELADSSYFLGFLLTLVLLAAGLWSLASTGGPASPGTPKNVATIFLYQFVYDLAAGLTLTIAGLAIRQVRTLGASRSVETAPAAAVASGFEPALRELIEALKQRQERAPGDPHEIRSHAGRATEDLERGIAEISPRILASMTKLEASVMSTSAALTRTASALGDSLTQTTERIDCQVTDVLRLLEKERAAMTQQLEQWCTMVCHAQQLISAGHQALDVEYRKSVTAVSAAGESFTNLSHRVVQEIERMPNPAERLQTLWTGVESLDQRLRASIGDTGKQLASVSAQAEATAASIERLSQSVRVTADRIEGSGGQISGSLQRELRDLTKVLDEFNGLLDQRVKMIGVR